MLQKHLKGSSEGDSTLGGVTQPCFPGQHPWGCENVPENISSPVKVGTF